MIQLSPSILSADFANLERDIRTAVAAGADWMHIDVMDGHFVPNITIGAPVVKSLRKICQVPMDVHLMISDPEKYLEDFIQAGSDYITVHLESNGDTAQQIRKIHAGGVKACVAIKPGTPVEEVLPYLPELEMALVMTVEPGFGGQGLIPECLEKVAALRKIIGEKGYDCLIQIDGGAKAANAAEIVRSGADVVVAGSAVFGGEIAENIQKIRAELEQGEAQAAWRK